MSAAMWLPLVAGLVWMLAICSAWDFDRSWFVPMFDPVKIEQLTEMPATVANGEISLLAWVSEKEKERESTRNSFLMAVPIGKFAFDIQLGSQTQSVKHFRLNIDYCLMNDCGETHRWNKFLYDFEGNDVTVTTETSGHNYVNEITKIGKVKTGQRHTLTINDDGIGSVFRNQNQGLLIFDKLNRAIAHTYLRTHVLINMGFSWGHRMSDLRSDGNYSLNIIFHKDTYILIDAKDAPTTTTTTLAPSTTFAPPSITAIPPEGSPPGALQPFNHQNDAKTAVTSNEATSIKTWNALVTVAIILLISIV